MNKFDIVYNSIRKKISLIVEDFSFKDDDNFSNFDFKKNNENDIICTFSIKKDEEEFIVIGKYFNNKISFVLTDNTGNSINYSEKEFATNYNKDYDNFKKELDLYLKKEDTTKDSKTEGNIDSFNEVIKDQENNNPDVKIEKSYKIDDTTFIFKLLNDISVENYTECIFDFQDEKTKEIIYVKSLLNILTKNSIIIKILFFNENNELMEKLTKSEFLRRYPEALEKLEKAINKFEVFIEEMK